MVSLKKIIYFAIAFPIVLITLLYTGIVRRFFYALPLAAFHFTRSLFQTKIGVGQRALLLTIVLGLAHNYAVKLPLNEFLWRFDSVMQSGSLYAHTIWDSFEGVKRTMPTAVEDVALVAPTWYHNLLVVPVLAPNYIILLGLFLGSWGLSILIDRFLRSVDREPGR